MIGSLEAKVLSGLLKDQPDDRFRVRMSKAMQVLSKDFFSDKHKVIYTVLHNYYIKTFARLPSTVLTDVLRIKTVAEDKIVLFSILFDEICEIEDLSDAQFLFSMSLLQENTRREQFADILISTMEILQKGKKIGREVCRGYTDAKRFFSEKATDIDKLSSDYVPDGDVNSEFSEMLNEQTKAKTKKGEALFTGLDIIDNLIGGLYGGEFFLVCGFTGDLKTTTCINIAHDVAYRQKKNVVYMTGETLRTQVRRRLLSLHSRERRFNIKQGLAYDSMKRGNLTEKETAIFKAVIEDMTSGQFGRFQILQFPRKANLDYVSGQLSRYQAEFNVDLLIVDEARLLGSRRTRVQRWEELDEILMGLKQIAVTHNQGKGVPVITPYQVKRDAWKNAIESKKPYDKVCLANSSEAERSADIIMTLMRVPENQGGNNREVRGSVLKNRDGIELSEFHLATELSSCYVGNAIESSGGLEDL